ncbi:glutathione binding-like protein [Polaromonas sp.]|uniref:glutathione binding-like protein n=1 Tax=Polaromonas sp. TaxID=1869339 RepID=UPI0035259134
MPGVHGRLADYAFFAGEEISIADFANVGWLCPRLQTGLSALKRDEPCAILTKR